MKSNKNVRYLIGKGLSNKTISTLSESQIKILVEKFKKENKEQTQVVTQVYDSKNPEEVKKLNQALQDPATLQGKNVQVKETDDIDFSLIKRLVFHFGDTEEEVKNKLYERDIVLQFEKEVVYEK